MIFQTNQNTPINVSTYSWEYFAPLQSQSHDNLRGYAQQQTPEEELKMDGDGKSELVNFQPKFI